MAPVNHSPARNKKTTTALIIIIIIHSSEYFFHQLEQAMRSFEIIIYIIINLELAGYNQCRTKGCASNAAAQEATEEGAQNLNYAKKIQWKVASASKLRKSFGD